jgi:hypothetical protein
MANGTCSKCKYRAYDNFGCIEYCLGYEMSEDICDRYEEGKPSCYEDDNYTPSATHGDYSPSSPWNAPGMSISDFI